MVCLKKKLCAADIIGDYILCLEREEVFGEMDILIEALISDLLLLMEYFFSAPHITKRKIFLFFYDKLFL